MDKVTPEAFMTFLWVGAALIAFALAVWNLIDKIKKARQPAQDAERWRVEIEAKLDRDKNRIDLLEEGQRAMCRGVLALLNHEITGNSVDKLKKAQDEMTDYLVER